MSSGSRRLIQIEKTCDERFSLALLIDSRRLDRRRMEHFDNEKGCGAAAALTVNHSIAVTRCREHQSRAATPLHQDVSAGQA
jgi:hypothetical protein